MAFGICLLWLLLSAVCSMHLIPVVSEQPGYVWSDRRSARFLCCRMSMLSFAGTMPKHCWRELNCPCPWEWPHWVQYAWRPSGAWHCWCKCRCLTLEDRPALDQSSSHSSFAADFLKSYVGTESMVIISWCALRFGAQGLYICRHWCIRKIISWQCEDEHIPAAEVAVVFAGNEVVQYDFCKVLVTEACSICNCMTQN